MYSDYYGLTGRPFQLTPDPRFYFDSATHRKAMAYLGYGLAQGEGFIVITGEVGAGKTTLVGHLMATVDPARLVAVRLVSTQVGGDDILRLSAAGFGVETEGLDKASLLARFEACLAELARTGRRALLIVDEAQTLPTAALEELRMLSNFQRDGVALLQIFLLGQPEFRDRLSGPDRLEQLAQRVIANHHLEPMQSDEIEPYIRHRLAQVGWAGTPEFTPAAFDAMYRFSRGLPRKLNALASRLLLLGAIERMTSFDGAAVDVVIEDFAASPIAVADETPFHESEPVATQPVQPFSIVPQRDDQSDRLDALEARLDEQDRALRRILTLLVDWVEGEAQRPNLEAVRDAAA